jgi:hypothetical protein
VSAGRGWADPRAGESGQIRRHVHGGAKGAEGQGAAGILRDLRLEPALERGPVGLHGLGALPLFAHLHQCPLHLPQFLRPPETAPARLCANDDHERRRQRDRQLDPVPRAEAQEPGDRARPFRPHREVLQPALQVFAQVGGGQAARSSGDE